MLPVTEVQTEADLQYKGAKVGSTCTATITHRVSFTIKTSSHTM